MVLLVVVLLIAAAGGIGWAAGRATLAPPVPTQRAREAVTYTVAETTVGRSLSLAAQAERAQQLLARNAASGVVTAAEPGVREVAVGSVLYRVNELPVQAVEGQVPFYRDMAAGANGTDVSQLQEFLRAAGYSSIDVDGRFRAGTAEGVRAWQRDTGQPVTGTVPAAALLAVSDLPAEITLLDGVTVGARLSGGEEAVARVAPDVAFQLVLSPEQIGLVPLNAPVVLSVGDAQVPASMGSGQATADGNLVIPLLSEQGQPLCAGRCAATVAPGPPVAVPARVVVVPDTTGPAVPVAALRTAEDGTVSVLMADGQSRPVTVTASSDGVAVVDGLEVDDVVNLTDAPASTSPDTSSDSSG